MRLIDLDMLLNQLHTIEVSENFGEVTCAEISDWIEHQSVILQWHKLIYRDLIDEEKECADPKWTCMVENIPELGEYVLVTDGNNIWIDSFDIDDCVYLSETGYELDSVVAWMELPKFNNN